MAMDAVEFDFRVRLFAIPSAMGWLVVAAHRLADTPEWTEMTYGPFPTQSEATTAIARVRASLMAGIRPSLN